MVAGVVTLAGVAGMLGAACSDPVPTANVNTAAVRPAASTAARSDRLPVPGLLSVSESSATVAVVEAVAWAAIALLAPTLVGSFFYLGTRLDSLGGELGRRIEALGSDLGRRIDSLNARVDALGADLSGRIDALSTRVDAQGADLGARIDGLSARMDQHLERHAG